MENQNIRNVNNELEQFSGTEQYYKHPFGFLYTDGVQYLASTFDCYWLLSDIILYNRNLHAERDFQVWKLSRCPDVMGETTSFNLVAEDGNKNVIFKTNIAYSTFKGDEVTIWLIDGVLLLPSEY